MIKRDKLLECREILNDFPVLALIGTRQSGKSTLAKELQKDYPNAVYLDLESPKDYNTLNDAQTFFEAHQNELVIIDEIQLKQELFATLRPAIDANRKPARFIILGSASPALMKKSTDSLAGRIAYVELEPLRITEVGFQNQEKLWIHGGYPEPFQKTKENANKWYTQFIRTYAEKELSSFGISISPIKSQIFWTMLAHFNGQTINYAQLAKSTELDQRTVKSYIEIFEYSFLLKQLRPFWFNIKKRYVKSPKMIFSDSGILHSLLQLNEKTTLFSSPYKGSSWEAFVINQIQHSVGESFDSYFYRTTQGAELDLVLVKGVNPEIGIEIKFGDDTQPSKGNEIAANDLEVKHKFLIHSFGKTLTYKTKNGWSICSFQDFLENQLPTLI